MAKTIAQMAILNWVESHFGMCNLHIEFTGIREASVVDFNGDSMTLKYDPDTREVHAI